MRNETESQDSFGFFALMGPLGRLLFAIGCFIIFWRGPGVFLGISLPDEQILAEGAGFFIWFELIGYVVFLLLGLSSLIRLIRANFRDRIDPVELFVAVMGTIIAVGFPFAFYASHLSG